MKTIDQLKSEYNASTEEELFANLTKSLLFCFRHSPEWFPQTQEDFIDLIKNY